MRAGDVIDYAYTVAGANPILEGRFADRLPLAYSTPVHRLRYRLVWPAGRPLFLKAHRSGLEPRVQEAPGTRTYVWEIENVPAVSGDDDVPDWYDPYPWIQVTEYASWGDVARWAHDLYARQARSSPALSALVESWKAAAPDPEARVLRAIRFVQDEVRYLGIEAGVSSHRPHPPAQVLAQRFGDCKDKALLLVTLLKALGVEAEPALVNTEVGRTLDEWLPSAIAFDHVIVRIRLADREHWVDATLADQGGPLSRRQPPEYERALPVASETIGLVRIPAAELPGPTRIVHESYTVTADPAATLVVETTYRGAEADRMRRSLARTPRAETAKSYLNHYARDDPGIEATSLPVFTDDRDANVVTSREEYRLPHFLKDGERDLYAWAVEEHLDKPRTRVRTMPWSLSAPVHVEHVLRVTLPRGFKVDPEDERLEDGARRFRFRSAVQGRTLILTHEYRSLRDSLAADGVAADLALVDRIESHLSYTFDTRRAAGAARSLSPEDRRIAWGVAGVLGLLGALYGVRRAAGSALRRLAAAREERARQGTTAGTAMAYRDPHELESRIETMTCPCGGRAWRPGVERVCVTYEGGPMTVITRHCGRCQQQQTFYFRVGPFASAPSRPSA